MFTAISPRAMISTVKRAATARSSFLSQSPSSRNSTTAAIVSTSCLSMSPGTEEATTDMPRVVR